MSDDDLRAKFHHALSALYSGKPGVDVAACLLVLRLADEAGLVALCGERYDVQALTADALFHYSAAQKIHTPN